MLGGQAPGELEVVVVCNGCQDRTAEIARSFGSAVRVVETAQASKSLALNLGDAQATGFPRIYVDADVVIGLASIRAMAKALETQAPAAAPRPSIEYDPATSWAVRAYYRAWMSLPYMQEGMVTAGVYGLSREGRARFGEFPDVLADDGYVRLLFDKHERVEVAEAESVVYAPTNLADLLRIRTRARLGWMELRQRFPELFAREVTPKRYAAALIGMALRPRAYLDAAIYVLVTAASLISARARARNLGRYVWARDDSSRSLPAAEG